MKFNKVTIENYKSFQYPTVISFPQSSEGNSIFLMGGMNGAGKTAIMEAIILIVKNWLKAMLMCPLS